MRHGSGRAGWRAGCRCPRCRASLRQWCKVNNAVQRLRRGAEPASRVDAERARQHIGQLRAAGLGMADIARRAGVAPRTVYRITSAPRISRIVERLVLAVEPEPRTLMSEVP